MLEWTNNDRQDFIMHLDCADFEITNWEADFVGNMLEMQYPNYTDKQKAVIDNLRDKYMDKMG